RLDPVSLVVRAPPAALPWRRARRVSARRADHRALEARARGGAVRPRPPGAGAPHAAGRRLAGRTPGAARRRRRAGGRAPVHVPARRAEAGHPHRDLRAARAGGGGSEDETGVPRPRDAEDGMSSGETFVIVGGGLAGAKAAQTLRDEGFDGRVVLLGEEAVAPYERPPLSKDYLRGDVSRDAIWAEEEGWYEAHDVELRTGARV